MHQQRTLSKTEKLMVRRWLLLMQKHCGLYNVDNRHQCLRDGDRARNIVQPFQYAQHFYGCLVCGQYHICRLHEASCVVVTEPVIEGTQRLTCQYSGQLLRHSEALVANAYDEASDDVPLGTTARSHQALGQQRHQCYTNMRGPRPTKRARLAQDSPASSSPSSSILHTVRSKHVYEPPTPDEIDMIPEDGGGGGVGEDEEGDGGGGGGGDGDGAYASLGTSVTYHPNYAYWSEHFSYLLDGNTAQQHGDGADQGLAQREAVLKVAPLPTCQPADGTTTTTTTFHADIITPAMRSDIEETTGALVHSLLRVQLKQQQRQPSPLELARLQNALGDHFAHLITNVAILVYNAPVLRTLHQHKIERAQRHHQKQRASDYAPAAVITPLELCLALMLRMLARGFYHEDVCDQVVELWSPNPWLRELLVYDTWGADIVSRVLDEKARSTRHKKRAALYTIEKLDGTVVHVKDCLAHYQGHALWARNFIQTHK